MRNFWINYVKNFKIKSSINLASLMLRQNPLMSAVQILKFYKLETKVLYEKRLDKLC
jgi:hypothetical protein